MTGFPLVEAPAFPPVVFPGPWGAVPLASRKGASFQGAIWMGALAPAWGRRH